MRRAPRRGGLAAGETERQRTPEQTVAKVPRQTSKRVCERYGEGVEMGSRTFLQQSPGQPDPSAARGTPRSKFRIAFWYKVCGCSGVQLLPEFCTFEGMRLMLLWIGPLSIRLGMPCYRFLFACYS